MGRWLIGLGLLLVVVGLVVRYAPWLVNWFGRLPGDIRIETERARVYIPITSMIIVSLIITLALNLFRR